MNRLTLYNMALAHFGGSSIQATDQAGNAEVCNDFINVVLDSAIEGFDFTFARNSAKLARSVGFQEIEGELPTDRSEYLLLDKTIGDFTYAFDLPKDFIQLRNVKDLKNGDWKIYGRVLATDSEEVTIDYTARIREIDILPNMFSEAISYALAYYIAPRISGQDNNRQAALYSQYDFFIKKAQGSDSGKEYLSVQGKYELVDE